MNFSARSFNFRRAERGSALPLAMIEGRLELLRRARKLLAEHDRKKKEVG